MGDSPTQGARDRDGGRASRLALGRGLSASLHVPLFPARSEAGFLNGYNDTKHRSSDLDPNQLVSGRCGHWPKPGHLTTIVDPVLLRREPTWMFKACQVSRSNLLLELRLRV